MVLDCAPEAHLPIVASQAEALANRLWLLLRAERIEQLRRSGVPVVSWSADQPIEVPTAALARREMLTR